MALNFHPKRGMLLICDFTTGFNPPEMTKKRPVIVLGEGTGLRGTCLVVPTSTKAPEPEEAIHVRLDPLSLPSRFRMQPTWAKCDMLTSVACWRLDRVMNGVVNGARQYVSHRVTDSDLVAVQRATLAALHLSSLGSALDELALVKQ